ncbi:MULTISPECIES: D-sedoheptulose-7-phosphate isomerase [Paenibacillus]|uniref:SIS domain-containing protein n=1 Tax=Paenibacillus radicis (ex Xue et al. 2023) TaxID=2972489 RepID=A0ABT1YLS0_9BACL|nr:SIS domain-containing protein [Paenibacillus radicis (ex Xue et al. 2023)]MCR8634131.1 SIS domain-containing protein [Paenibacillus radicis (ex Xue et al. 2023)]
MNPTLSAMCDKYPELTVCIPDMEKAITLLKSAFHSDGKLLLCGNGGSASDSEHIVGELMKGFRSPRLLNDEDREPFLQQFPEEGNFLAGHLQGALPAISLVSHTALANAYANDVSSEMVFAQQVYGYGRTNDILLGISTSGNSLNVIRAVQVAKVRGLQTIGLTGRSGGRMAALCDVTIRVPWDLTPDIQERHLPIYHALCIVLEEEFFPS